MRTPAASLRSFQNEIEEILLKETAKQRAQGHLELEKENKNPASATSDSLSANVQAGKRPVADDELDDERELQTLLLSESNSDHGRARDILAGFLTSHKGEYILRFGSCPPHTLLFFGDASTSADGWIGTPRSEKELQQLCREVIRLVEEIGGKVSTLYPFSDTHLRIALLLRLPPPSVALLAEVRCAVVGNVDSGKSTTLGVLTRGGLDDGRGRARVGLFRHKHEVETGRTSSVGMEILGFAPSGEPILPATAGSMDQDTIRREKLGWDEITLQAAKVVSFIDLAGHEKYLKTTLYGLTSGSPSCVMLMVGANAGLIGMSKEHLAISLALNVPIDMTPPNVLAETIKQVVKILKSPGCRKTPVFVNSIETSVEVSQVFAQERLCPIFQLSNVSGKGLDLVRTFLNLLPSSEGDGNKFASDQPLEYSITEVWSVPYVGTVVNGILNAGHVKVGDAICLGPDSNGGWHSTVIKSMQRKRATVTTADAGQCVSLALKRTRRAAVRKGMVIVAKTENPPRAIRRFMGQVLILYHNTTLQKGYQAMLHCGAVRQTVKIVGMDNPQGVLRTGDRASVEFEFISHPEFIKEDDLNVPRPAQKDATQNPRSRRSKLILLALVVVLLLAVLYRFWFRDPDTDAGNHPPQQGDAEQSASSVSSSTTAPQPTQNPSEGDKGEEDKMPSGKYSVGYFVNWGIYGRKFPPQKIPVQDLTHILYAFADLRADSGVVHLTDVWSDKDIHYEGDSWDESGTNLYGNFKALYKLKQQNRHLKTLLSIGGWTYSPHFHPTVVSGPRRKNFVLSAIRLMEDLGLDGLDIDYEYPSNAYEALGYVKLLKELREGLDSHAQTKGADYRFLLTIAAPCGPDNYKRLHAGEMDQYLDFWNLMAYDYSGSWDTIANHQANVYGGPISTNETVQWYISQGVPRHKLIVGMPLYGRSFLATDGPGTPFSGIGPGSWEAGVYDYRTLPLPGSFVMRDEKTLASWTYDYQKREMLRQRQVTHLFTLQMTSIDQRVDLKDAKAAADSLARAVHKEGMQYLTFQHFFSVMPISSTLFTLLHRTKKSGYERESAAIGFQYLASILGTPAAPILLPSLPAIMDLYMDKGDVVRIAAVAATKTILRLFPPEATRIVFLHLEDILEKGKWRTKVGALDSIRGLVDRAKDEVAAQLGDVLPKVERAMHDTKPEVSTAAKKCATALCTTVANPDLTPHIPVLVECMSNPSSVQACMKALSSTTFVAEVTAPALALVVPLCMRALSDRSMEVQRRTVVVIDNLVKLVRNPKVAAIYLSGLVEGVEKIMKGASFPEVRAFAESAYNTLIKAGASKTGPPPPTRNITEETSSAKSDLISLLPSHVKCDRKHLESTLNTSLEFQAGLVADLISYRKLSDKDAWNRSTGSFILPWLSNKPEEASKFSESVRQHYEAIESAKYAPEQNGNDEDGEILCNTLFSLAYGTLLLLSHTSLRLIRGRRYGILGTNGSGKSTLMRQLRDGKVENFPPQSELRCIMVEHALQGEDTSLSIIEFITTDKALSNIPHEKVVQQLTEVGFDEGLQKQLVGSLSGGWKMRLELARAMLYDADLLLLDEPTNHMDVKSVKWLEDYLISRKNVTCLIISHDSGFLDHVTTDIIHYESKKLVYYRGNLSNFVAKHPEANSYYTLAATSVKFSFPPPGSLMGVRSNTRAILKMTNCTYTYPGRDTPSLFNVSCALSLSSRVGIIGPNGAGKSTLIKLLTGETVPQEGSCYKHPSLRIGYVSQYATHHIGELIRKATLGKKRPSNISNGVTKMDLIVSELLEKITRVLTDEEKAQLEVPFVGKDGTTRKLEHILGRQKLKKSFQYEVKWRGLDHRYNTWVPRDDLLSKGFSKVVQQFDDLESSREGAGTRDTAAHLVRKHLEDIGLDGDIAQYNEISQKIKLVIAACLWNNPQICVLDEPSNFLDREALGGLAVAIRDWAGAVVIISHNTEFITALCPEIWNVEAGRMTSKGKSAVVEEAFADVKSPKGSGANTPARSRAQTPAASAKGSPAVSGTESNSPSGLVKKKKKKTRNQLKAQEERRRIRKVNWLAFGGERPEDTDSD
ncbi:hypothetical protein EW145_g3336 [Phellinidium pouzarii]|uniref:chitinase n=1 Tax=Phellinidium pouzarii TaxID=167371 RepID=A0A4S4L7Q5_9AGAM|nr:hypothetical protein EW145_g3336 [Phellinidium pouzarii]